MSCARMEKWMLPYVDGRLKEGERLEMEKHLAACGACRLRVNEFRAVSGLLEELPVVEPSAAFDMRVHALVAAEPVKRSWWAWLAPAPRVAFVASMLLLATLWIGMRPSQPQIAQEDIPVLENYDVLSNFDVLTELPQPVPADEAGQANQQM